LADGTRYDEVQSEATKGCVMKISASAWLITAASAAAFASASAQQVRPAGVPYSPPFTATLSNTTPLVFGMDAEQTSRALGTPLQYVSGRPGDEIYLAFRNIGGNPLFSFFKSDRLYLQFRQGRLAGWKADWGHNWMWQ
jgi:hypothetical protein